MTATAQMPLTATYLKTLFERSPFISIPATEEFAFVQTKPAESPDRAFRVVRRSFVHREYPKRQSPYHPSMRAVREPGSSAAPQQHNAIAPSILVRREEAVQAWEEM